MFRVNNGNPEDSTSGSGGFTFDLAGLNAVLAEWTQLRDDLVVDDAIAEGLVAVEGPGREVASDDLANSATNSGERFREHNLAMQKFAQAYIDNLTRARQDYLASDAAGRSNFQGGQG